MIHCFSGSFNFSLHTHTHYTSRENHWNPLTFYHKYIGCKLLNIPKGPKPQFQYSCPNIIALHFPSLNLIKFSVMILRSLSGITRFCDMSALKTNIHFAWLASPTFIFQSVVYHSLYHSFLLHSSHHNDHGLIFFLFVIWHCQLNLLDDYIWWLGQLWSLCIVMYIVPMLAVIASKNS